MAILHCEDGAVVVKQHVGLCSARVAALSAELMRAVALCHRLMPTSRRSGLIPGSLSGRPSCVTIKPRDDCVAGVTRVSSVAPMSGAFVDADASAPAGRRSRCCRRSSRAG